METDLMVNRDSPDSTFEYEHECTGVSDVEGSTTNELEEELPKMAIKGTQSGCDTRPGGDTIPGSESQTKATSFQMPHAKSASRPSSLGPGNGMPEGDEDTSDSSKFPWYSDTKYRRYWKHLRSVQNWFRKHQEVYNSYCRKQWAYTYQHWHKLCHAQYVNHCVQQQYYGQMLQTLGTNCGEGATYKTVSQGLTKVYANSKNKKARRRIKKKNKVLKKMSKERIKKSKETSSESVMEIEMETEMTEELLDFMVQSALHRKERDALKAELAEKEELEGEHVDAGEANLGKHQASSKAPSERPGSRRTAEMKALYGKGAAMIHGMETAMQLQFDRQSDLAGAQLWPHLPLNIKFS